MKLLTSISQSIFNNMPFICCLIGFAIINFTGLVELNSGIIVGMLIISLHLKKSLQAISFSYTTKL